MTAAQWGVLGVIGTLVLGAITLYFLARSNARENKRQAEAVLTKAVLDATQPLLDRIADRDRQNGELQRTKERLLSRIDQLEDELRRGGHD